MSNFRDVYFHYLSLRKFKQFVFCQFFKKSQWFWLTFVFTEYFNRRKFSLILSFFVKVYLAKILKSSICESLSCKVFLISLFQFFCIIEPHVSKKLSSNFQKFVICKSLFSKIFYIAQLVKVYPKNFNFFPSWKFL